MEGFKSLFIKHLTEDKKQGYATAIFNKENGKQLWTEINLDMILKVYDEAIIDYKRQLNE